MKSVSILLAAAILFTTMSANAASWQDVPFDANNFYGSAGMGWWVNATNVTRNEYLVDNGRLQWNVSLIGTSIDGAPSVGLMINTPEFVKPAKSGNVGTFVYSNGGVYGTGVIYVNKATSNADSRIWLLRNFDYGPNLNWRRSNADTYIIFNLDMAVQ